MCLTISRAFNVSKRWMCRILLRSLPRWYLGISPDAQSIRRAQGRRNRQLKPARSVRVGDVAVLLIHTLDDRTNLSVVGARTAKAIRLKVLKHVFTRFLESLNHSRAPWRHLDLPRSTGSARNWTPPECPSTEPSSVRPHPAGKCRFERDGVKYRFDWSPRGSP